MKILIVRKMPAIEFFYNGSHKSEELRKSKKEHDESIEKIGGILTKLKQEYYILTRNELTAENVELYDLVFSAGGDGTAISAAAFNKKIPQLNLKTDKKSKGTLCHENIEEAISNTIQGKFELKFWTRQDVYLNQQFVGRALNETCIGEKLNFSKMARYELFFIDSSYKRQKEFQRNSGLIVATGTGSTGWPSIFKPYPKEADVFSLRAVMPYEGEIESAEGLYFKITYKGHEGKFAIDTKEYDFPRDSVLEIKLSKNPLLVIMPAK